MAVLESSEYEIQDSELHTSGYVALKEVFEENFYNEYHDIDDRGKFCKTKFFQNLRQNKISKEVLRLFLEECSFERFMVDFIIDLLPMESMEDALELGLIPEKEGNEIQMAFRKKMFDKVKSNPKEDLKAILDYIYNERRLRENMTSTSYSLNYVIRYCFMEVDDGVVKERTEGALEAVQSEYGRLLDLFTNENLYGEVGYARLRSFSGAFAQDNSRRINSYVRGVSDMPYLNLKFVLEDIVESDRFSNGDKSFILMKLLFDIRRECLTEELLKDNCVCKTVEEIIRLEDSIKKTKDKDYCPTKMREASDNLDYNLSQAYNYVSHSQLRRAKLIFSEIRNGMSEDERKAFFNRFFRTFRINSQMHILTMLDMGEDAIIEALENTNTSEIYLPELGSNFHCLPKDKDSYPSKRVFTYINSLQTMNSNNKEEELKNIDLNSTYEEVLDAVRVRKRLNLITFEMARDLEWLRFLVQGRVGSVSTLNISPRSFDTSHFKISEIEEALLEIDEVAESNLPSDCFNLKYTEDCYLNNKVGSFESIDLEEFLLEDEIKKLPSETLNYFRYSIPPLMLSRTENLVEETAEDIANILLEGRELSFGGRLACFANNTIERKDFSEDYKIRVTKKMLKAHRNFKLEDEYRSSDIKFGIVNSASKLTVEEAYELFD